MLITSMYSSPQSSYCVHKTHPYTPHTSPYRGVPTVYLHPTTHPTSQYTLDSSDYNTYQPTNTVPTMPGSLFRENSSQR